MLLAGDDSGEIHRFGSVLAATEEATCLDHAVVRQDDLGEVRLTDPEQLLSLLLCNMLIGKWTWAKEEWFRERLTVRGVAERVFQQIVHDSFDSIKYLFNHL